MLPDARLIGETVLTLSIGIAGALLFWLIGLPAAFLTGPAACVTLAALFGSPLRIPMPLRTFCFVTIGLGIGSGVSPEVMATALSWPVSFAFLALVQWLSILIGALLLLRLFRFGKDEAIICAVPGLLSFIVSLTMDRGADVARVSLVQSVRVLVLALVVPILLKLWGADISATARAMPDMAIYAVLPLLGVVWISGSFFGKMGLPAAHIMSGVVVGAASSLTGLTRGGIPAEISIMAFVIIGSLIGTRFRGRRVRDMGADVRAGLVVTCSAAVIALIGAWLVSWVLGLPLAPLLIAFAPGGLEVMIAMSIQLGLDPTFVAAHHVARLLILMALVPLALRRIEGKKSGLQ